MGLTVDDIIGMPELQGMKMIAGSSGGKNIVTRCGLLDYEYDPEVKDKFLHHHFREGQFVLTSFLYAKKNEFLILDAVKRLHQRGCSGLVIRNIYKLNIRDNVCRYADANQFPLLIIAGNNLFFEDIIHLVTDRAKKFETVYNDARVADAIRYSSLDTETMEHNIRMINASFGDVLVGAYMRLHDEFSPNDFLSLASKPDVISLFSHSDKIFYYKNGIMIIHSCDQVNPSTMISKLDRYIHAIRYDVAGNVSIGTSAIHHNILEFKDILEESISASCLPCPADRLYHAYPDIGLFKVFMAVAHNTKAADFSKSYVDVIQSYDNENNASLLQTAQHYVLSDGDLGKTAEKLNLHMNTIRYRLDIISSLVNEKIMSKSGYESFSAAIKIDLCRRAVS